MDTETRERHDEVAIRMSLLHGALYRRGLRKWQKAARDTPLMNVAALRRTRARARAVLAALRASPRADDTRRPAGPTRVHPALPHGTDWCWRPEVWQAALPEPDMGPVPSHTVTGGEVTVFHDGPPSDLPCARRATQAVPTARPTGCSLRCSPSRGRSCRWSSTCHTRRWTGLTRRHLVRLDTIVELENPLKVFARLNVKHGPNTEQIVRELPPDASERMVEFDLAYSGVNEKRLDRAWIDLIFETPHMTSAALRDVILSRRLRADL